MSGRAAEQALIEEARGRSKKMRAELAFLGAPEPTARTFEEELADALEAALARESKLVAALKSHGMVTAAAESDGTTIGSIPASPTDSTLAAGSGGTGVAE